MDNQQLELSVKTRWTKLDGERTSVLDRAKACAELTIPSLIVDVSHTETTELSTPYQSLGSRAVNNLASKLLLSLLPPSSPFFRFVPDKIAMLELEESQPGSIQQIQSQLADIEQALKSAIEREALRVPLFHALKLLVATGNSLLFRSKDGKMKVFNLNNYCIKRSPSGKLQEILTKETINIKDLPSEMLKGDEEDKNVDIYTIVKWNGVKFESFQEALDTEIPGTRGVFSVDTLPYIPLRWTSIAGEDYGRGLVEQYLGDLRTLESLHMSIIEASSASSKILFLVNPASTTKISKLTSAPSGSFISGKADDITTMQVQKQNDLRIAYEVSQDIQRRLASAFLLNESARREGERVTATEINLLAGELEDALGGIYSILTQELQLPLIKLMMASQKIKFPEDLVEPVIVTGVEALGRGHDYNKLIQFSQTLQQLLGAEIVAQYTNVPVFIEQIGMSLGIDTKAIIKTQEQIAQEQQQAQEGQLAMQGLGSMAETAGQQAGQQIM